MRRADQMQVVALKMHMVLWDTPLGSDHMYIFTWLLLYSVFLVLVSYLFRVYTFLCLD